MIRKINKKGVSAVIATIILVGIAVVLAGMIFSVIIPMVRKNIEHASACSPEIIGKVKLNQLHTCYDEDTKTIKVSAEIEDLDYDKIIVKISQAGTSKEKEIKGQAQNSGKTHEYNVIDLGLTGKPDTITLTPVIDSQQCGVSDSMNNIQYC